MDSFFPTVCTSRFTPATIGATILSTFSLLLQIDQGFLDRCLFLYNLPDEVTAMAPRMANLCEWCLNFLYEKTRVEMVDNFDEVEIRCAAIAVAATSKLRTALGVYHETQEYENMHKMVLDKCSSAMGMDTFKCLGGSVSLMASLCGAADARVACMFAANDLLKKALSCVQENPMELLIFFSENKKWGREARQHLGLSFSFSATAHFLQTYNIPQKAPGYEGRLLARWVSTHPLLHSLYSNANIELACRPPTQQELFLRLFIIAYAEISFDGQGFNKTALSYVDDFLEVLESQKSLYIGRDAQISCSHTSCKKRNGQWRGANEQMVFCPEHIHLAGPSPIDERKARREKKSALSLTTLTRDGMSGASGRTISMLFAVLVSQMLQRNAQPSTCSGIACAVAALQGVSAYDHDECQGITSQCTLSIIAAAGTSNYMRSKFYTGTMQVERVVGQTILTRVSKSFHSLLLACAEVRRLLVDKLELSVPEGPVLGPGDRIGYSITKSSGYVTALIVNCTSTGKTESLTGSVRVWTHGSSRMPVSTETEVFLDVAGNLIVSPTTKASVMLKKVLKQKSIIHCITNPKKLYGKGLGDDSASPEQRAILLALQRFVEDVQAPPRPLNADLVSTGQKRAENLLSVLQNESDRYEERVDSETDSANVCSLARLRTAWANSPEDSIIPTEASALAALLLRLSLLGNMQLSKSLNFNATHSPSKMHPIAEKIFLSTSGGDAALESLLARQHVPHLQITKFSIFLLQIVKRNGTVPSREAAFCSFVEEHEKQGRLGMNVSETAIQRWRAAANAAFVVCLDGNTSVQKLCTKIQRSSCHRGAKKEPSLNPNKRKRLPFEFEGDDDLPPLRATEQF